MKLNKIIRLLILISMSGTISVQSALAESLPMNALDLGVKCDGHTDDTVAMNGAIAIAAATNSTLLLPAGNCMVKSLGNMPSVVHIQGQGPLQTTLYETDPYATMFNVFNPKDAIYGVQRFEIENLSISALGNISRAPTATTFDLPQNTFVNIHNITIGNMGTNFKTENSAVQVQLNVDKVTISSTVQNGIDFDISQCFICTISNTNAFHNANARPWADIVLRNMQGQLQLINDNLDQANQGIVIMPGAGQVVTLVKANMLYLDNNPAGALNCSPTGNGIVQRIMIQNSWLTDNPMAVNCTGGTESTIDQLSFDNTEFVGSTASTQMVFSRVTNLSVINSRFLASSPGANIFLADVTNCNITGNTLGGATGVVLSGKTDYCNIHDNMNAYVKTPVVSAATGTHNRTNNP